jgi:hypothetical protein
MSKNKKKSKKAPKRNRYTPLGNAVNSEVSIVQAALLLDEAAHNALESKDTEAMAGVARGWMELGVLIHNMSVGAEDDEEDDGDVTSETSILGFGSKEAREVAEDARKSKS